MKLLLAALFNSVLNVPLFIYKNGQNGLVHFCLTVNAFYIIVAVWELLRQAGAFPRYFENRSFGRILRIGLAYSIVAAVASFVVTAFPEFIKPSGFQDVVQGFLTGIGSGLFPALITEVPFASIDTPRVRNPRVWARIGVFGGIIWGTVVFIIRGHSTLSLCRGIGAMLAFQVGLWLGLILGYNLNRLTDALRPTFLLLRKMARTLIAFFAGYLAIIVIFATLFASIWKLEGPESFVGMPIIPRLFTFIYFSLITATTIGYGDIVPKSEFARSLASVESIVSLAWTLVVFAALAVKFADAARDIPKKTKPDAAAPSASVKEPSSSL
ncbi:MAG: potassium channel family protein [Terracidiphilus sp.]